MTFIEHAELCAHAELLPGEVMAITAHLESMCGTAKVAGGFEKEPEPMPHFAARLDVRDSRLELKKKLTLQGSVILSFSKEKFEVVPFLLICFAIP